MTASSLTGLESFLVVVSIFGGTMFILAVWAIAIALHRCADALNENLGDVAENLEFLGTIAKQHGKLATNTYRQYEAVSNALSILRPYLTLLSRKAGEEDKKIKMAL